MNQPRNKGRTLMTDLKKHILLIEDEKEIRDSLTKFLESENYFVQAAESGRAALDFMDKSEMPDLILLDMRMPEMNGWQFAEEFYRIYDHKAPLMVMSAAADIESRSQEIKADSFIGKPFNLDDLLKKVKVTLEAPKRN